MKRAIAIAAAFIVWAFLSHPAVADEPKEEKLTPIKPEAVDLGRPVDFEKDVYPILEANCIACHNLAIAESRLNLEEVETILKGGKRGAAVVPKQPDKSLLYLAASRGQKPAMPPLPNDQGAKALTPKELGILRQWILEGAGGGAGAAAQKITWQPVPSSMNQIYSVAVSPWARYIAAGRVNQIYVYDLPSREQIARLTDPALEPVQFEGGPMYPGGAAHRDFVHALAFSPDGELLASAGYRVVKLWRKQLPAPGTRIELPAEPLAAAVSSDGKWAAVAAADNSIHLVSFPLGAGLPTPPNRPTAGLPPREGRPPVEVVSRSGDRDTARIVRTLRGHASAVKGLAFSPDGSKLFSASLDKSVIGWNVADGRPVRRIETPAAVNDVLVSKDASFIITAAADNKIRVWKAAPDLQIGRAAAADQPAAAPRPRPDKPVREIAGHSGPVTSLALLPGGTQFVSGSEDKTVRLWELNNGRQVRAMNHGGPVVDVAVRPDGQALVSASSGGTAKLWQVNNGQQLAEIKGSIDARRQVARLTDEQRVARQEASIAKNRVTAADKAVKDQEEVVKKAKEEKTKAENALAEARKKAEEADKALAEAKKELEEKPDDKDLKKKVEEAQKKATAEAESVEKAKAAHEGAEQNLQLAEKLLERNKDKLTEAQKGQQAADSRSKKVDADLAEAQKAEQSAAGPIAAVAFTADGKRLVTADETGLVQLWDAGEGSPLRSISGHEGAVVDVAGLDGDRLFSASKDNLLVVRSIQPVWRLIGRLGPKNDSPLDVSTSPFVSRVLCLDFSPDGRLLATGGGEASRAGELMVWDVEKRDLIREISDAHSDTVLGLEFSRDGKYLLSGAADKFAKIHEVATGKHVRSFEGHTHHVLDVSWKADGTSIVTAGADEVIKVWNAETAEQRRTIGGHGKQVTSVQFLGAGDNILSCGGDRTVRFHRTTNGQNFRNFGGGGDYMYSCAAGRDVEAVQKGEDATIVVAAGAAGVIRVWSGRNAQSVVTFEPPEPPADAKATASATGAQKQAAK